MCDYDFIDFNHSPTVKMIDKHLVVIIMSLCMGYFALFLFDKMINVE